MFWNPNQTGQRKQKEIPLARKAHPQAAPRKPANSNRETILLEPHATPTKQTTEGGSNREKNAIFTPPSTRPPQPSPSLERSNSLQGGQRFPANRTEIRQTRRKRENLPLNFV